MDKLKIIDEYRQITEQIAVLKSQKTSVERDLTKMSMTFRPLELKGMDYSMERVQRSSNQTNMFEMAEGIVNAQFEIQLISAELESWYKQRAELERVINELGDIKKRVVMLQIKGYPQWKIAKELNYSKRQIERIIADSKNVGEMSV